MNLRDWFGKFQLRSIRINASIFEADIEFSDDDKNAAWELYVEMLTRIVTQPLPSEHGDDKTALDSVYSLFPTTRGILRQRGRRTIQFSKIAIPVLNQIVRPFTAKWHRESLQGAFQDAGRRAEFRSELANLQADLRNYNRMLAEVAGIEDLTDMEQEDQE